MPTYTVRSNDTRKAPVSIKADDEKTARYKAMVTLWGPETINNIPSNEGRGLHVNMENSK